MTVTTTTTIAASQVRRLCLGAVEARERSNTSAARVKELGALAPLDLRAQAHRDWREAESAERLVRTLPIQTLLEATGGPAVPKNGEQLSLEDVLNVVKRIREGETPYAVAKSMDRRPDVIYGHMEKWEAGTSKVAKQAKAKGLWPHGRVTQ